MTIEEAIQTALMSAAEGKQVVALINGDFPQENQANLADLAVTVVQEPEVADADEVLTPLTDYRV